MKPQLEPIEFSLPVHLDFTSVCGAALALDGAEIREGRLPFSRLMALSQLVEAIVIHDQLQYELGSTPDWVWYRDYLEKSNLLLRCEQLNAPLRPYEEQVDADDASVLSAAEWAVDQLGVIPLAPLEWAVRFRSGTYEAVPNVVDANSPVLKRNLETIRKLGTGDLWQRVCDAQIHLQDNHVGPLGLHVLMRVRLLQQHLCYGNRANYLPHFSRQPLVVTTNDSTFQLRRWTIELIRKRREELLKGNEPLGGADELSVALSPIFLSCIQDAKRPEDILEAALRLRDTEEARTYRDDCREVIAKAFTGPGRTLQDFKLRVRRAVEGLAVNLPGDDVRVERKTQTGASFSILEVGYISIVRETSRVIESHLGSRSGSFLNDVLGHAMGVVRAQDRLSEVYGVNVQYDSGVVSWHAK